MLLNKAVLGLAKLASTEESRYCLQAVSIEPDSAIVTNGHYLVTVQNTKAESKDYPVIDGGLASKALTGSDSLLIAREAMLAALKAVKSLGKRARNLPILQNAFLGGDNKLHVSGLDSVSSFAIGDNSGKFPNWRAVVPNGEPQAQIALDAKYIRLLADYIAEHGEERLTAMRLTIYNEQTACRIDARTSDGQDVTAILMPLRMEKCQFAELPKAEPKAEPVAA